MQRALEQLVEALERAPNTPVRELDILPAAERALSARGAEPDGSGLSVAAVRARVVRGAGQAGAGRRGAGAWAVELSYGELNAEANRLAHHLIGLGVKPDQPVAICVERSPAMVVGVLAILKAGGAYLPARPGLSVRAAQPGARRCRPATHALRCRRPRSPRRRRDRQHERD
ncbi:AMP-binding protein [Sinorhizobium terangae]|uniref:AMP-binding protein n=1 Tax=Sinorhizobium terangae TaxID=110322 RepID=UPI00362EFDFA